MAKKILLIILFCLFFLEGCYDASEPNDNAYIVALGVDTSEQADIYEFTIQFAKATQVSGGSSEQGGEEGGEIVDMVRVKAPSVYSGMNIANQIVSKRFTLAHTKLIVISDEIAKKGLKNLFDTFGRNSDIRPNIYIAVANGKAKDYLENVKPVAEVDPVTYYRLIYESDYGGYIPKIILKEFYSQLDGKNKQNVAPIAGVNAANKQKSEQDKLFEETGQKNEVKEELSAEINKNGFDYLMKRYIAGNLDADKKNASEVIGMAVFKNDTMIGTMDNIECLLYSMIQGSFERSYISFYNEKTPTIPITVAIEQERSPYEWVKFVDGRPKATVKIHLEGQLISESVDSPIEDDIEQMETQIENEVKQAIERFLIRTSEEFNSDIIGFGQWAKINFLTYDEYEKYDWNMHYQEIEFNVGVDFRLRSIGFIDLSDNSQRGT